VADWLHGVSWLAVADALELPAEGAEERFAPLPEEQFVDSDQLIYDDSSPFELIYLLNEDFFQGGLTDAPFRSDRKSPR
jgi:hypothetical protein